MSWCPSPPLLLDTEALVKLVDPSEPGASSREEAFERALEAYTSPFCLGEALGVLKRKRKDKQAPLSDDHYFGAAITLAAYCSKERGRIRVLHLDFDRSDVFAELREIAIKHSIDLVDATLIYHLRKEQLSPFRLGHVHLVTGDRRLRNAALVEEFKVLT